MKFEMLVEYNYEDDTITVTIDTEGEDGTRITSETISYKDFLDMLPDEKAKLQHILQELYENRRSQVSKLGDITQRDLTIMEAIAKVRQEMVATDKDDFKQLKKLDSIIKSFLSEKDMLMEIRHAIKLDHIEEGKLLAELEKLEV